MNFSALWPTKYASRPIDVAHAMPPSAFQNRKVGQDMRVDARHPRGGDAQPGHPAPEEDRLGPVAVEERLADRDHAAAVMQERAGRGQRAAAQLAADREADVVAQDRRRGRDGDDGLDRQVPAAGDDAGGDQRGLARDRDAHRLDRDEQEDDRQADVLGDVQEGREGHDHHVASSMPAVPALTITARDAGSRARAGILRTAHGDVRTPAFVPLATKATVKGMLPAEVAALGYDIVLGNTFHLFLDPGHERIARFGGLHDFMGWSGPIVTDSGGFQVFSMGHGTVADEIKGRTPHGGKRQGGIIAIEERGVRFRSYLDGSERFMAPETSMEIQAALGSDLALVFDECTPLNVAARLHRALDRAHAPLAAPLPGLAPRARPRRPARLRHRPGRRLRGPARRVRPGGRGQRVRRHRDRRLAGRRQGRDAHRRRLDDGGAGRRADRPRHLLGIGEIDDLVRGVELGIDTFDCAMPTRLGPPRHGARPRPRAAAGASTSARRAGRTPTSR